ncbi:CPBP family intramembrane glutamic endopeptidase [Amycolatopsis aidingensis]|uniref:CPBP family intramembrane glutamic endopeptidase n=1 Tax=Amycolatopsis aidingensis TaxID=2842453 RepID=UPI001C0DE0D6|nr:type II CAAX endopeptidase family protein [Amycolatopsis aidingensis]
MDQEHDPGGPPAVRDGLVLGAHWGFLAFFTGVGGYYLTSLVLAAVLVGGFTGMNVLDVPEIGPVILVVFLPNLALGLGPVLGSWLRGRGLRADFGLLPDLRDLKVGLACGGFALLTGYVLNLLLIAVYGSGQAWDDPLGEVSERLGGATVWLLVTAAIVVLLAPLTEELLLRGALWNGLRHHHVPAWVILLLTALVFALLHGEPHRTVALLGQGVAIGAARLITGRTGASVVAHAANNLPPAVLLVAAS